MRSRTRAASVLAAAVTTLAAGFAGWSPLPGSGPEDAAAFLAIPVSKLPEDGPYIPMRATPEYGDGLGAGRGHEGQDLFAPAGTPLVAVDDAVVLETGSDGGRGNYISIYDAKRKLTYNYFHMLGAALVGSGERVDAGQKLGELGCTGSCWGDHLHFEVRGGRSSYGPTEDPAAFLEGLKLARPEPRFKAAVAPAVAAG